MSPVIIASLWTWVSVWLAATIFLVFRHWRRHRGVGLVLSYVVSFGSMYTLSAVVYLLPWYLARDPDLVALGMRQSAIAMVAFAVGGELALFWIRRREGDLPLPEIEGPDDDEDEDDVLGTGGGARDETLSLPVNPTAATLYGVVGVLLYVLVSPFAQRVASLAAIVNTGSTLAVVGLELKCWNGVQTGRNATVWFWLGVGAIAPLVTVATQGFLGYGMAATVTLGAFVAMAYGPRLRMVVLSMLMAYLGLSVYVTYMRDRDTIRHAVWSGNSMNDRMQHVADTISTFEWFDPRNADHLDRVETRLNQDDLIGRAVTYIGRGGAPFARGRTFFDAGLALIPRLVWPNKPMAAGSGDLVSEYTGMDFSRTTSVGVGQVLEAYINFGTSSVIAVFVLIGFGVVIVDRSAARALMFGDAGGFALWYMPGLSLLLVGGSFVEATSSAGAAFLVAWGLNRVVRRLREPMAIDYHAPDAQET